MERRNYIDWRRDESSTREHGLSWRRMAAATTTTRRGCAGSAAISFRLRFRIRSGGLAREGGSET
jgi:hypothetical protein